MLGNPILVIKQKGPHCDQIYSPQNVIKIQIFFIIITNVVYNISM